MRLTLAILALVAATTSAMAETRPSCVLNVAQVGAQDQPPFDLSTVFGLGQYDNGIGKDFDLNLVALRSGGNFYTLLGQDALPQEVQSQLATFAVVKQNALRVELIEDDASSEVEVFMGADMKGKEFDYGQPTFTVTAKGDGTGEGSIKLDLPGDDVTATASCNFADG
jgi:hypothetical protein